MENTDQLLIDSYWLLRKLTCYKLLAENAIILKDTATLYLNLIMFYYQIANKTLYTALEKKLFYEKNIKRYLYVFEVIDKIKPFLKRKTFSEFVKFYGKKEVEGKTTNKLNHIWETYPQPLDSIPIEEIIKLNNEVK